MSQKISTKVPFQKFHGAGNDFILVTESDLIGISPGDFALKACDRNYGIGSDGLIVVAPSENSDLKMIFYNPDGTRDVCGNGIRCVALYQYMQKTFQSMSLEIDNDTVWIEALSNGTRFKVQMHVRGEPSRREIFLPEETIEGHLVNTGTPHFVTVRPDLEALAIQEIGSALEHHKSFSEAVSVDFVKIIDPHTVEIRIWERSVGETLACGTAACAVAVAMIREGSISSPVRIKSRGGELEVEYGKDLYLTGPAEFVFQGMMTI